MHQERQLAHYPASPFRLLDLPAEIRNAIYRYILVLQEPIELAPLAWSRPLKQRLLNLLLTRYREDIIPRLSLLRTSSQLHGEGSSIFYGENQFRFSNAKGWYVLSSFLHTIGPRNQALVKTIAVHTPWCGLNVDVLRHMQVPCFPGSELQELGLTYLPRQYRRETGHGNMFACFLHVKTVLETAGALAESQIVLPEPYRILEGRRERYKNKSGCVQTMRLLDPTQFEDGRLRVSLVRLCTFYSKEIAANFDLSYQQQNRRKIFGDGWTESAKEQRWEVKTMTYDETSRYPVPLDEEEQTINVC